jgi:hypothetical protein
VSDAKFALAFELVNAMIKITGKNKRKKELAMTENDRPSAGNEPLHKMIVIDNREPVTQISKDSPLCSTIKVQSDDLFIRLPAADVAVTTCDKISSFFTLFSM